MCRCVFLQESKTPFDLAVDKGNTEVVRMIADFREHGPMALALYEKGTRKRSATAPATSLTPHMQRKEGKETVSFFSSLHDENLLQQNMLFSLSLFVPTRKQPLTCQMRLARHTICWTSAATVSSSDSVHSRSLIK